MEAEGGGIPNKMKPHEESCREGDRVSGSSVKWLFILNLRDDTPGKLFRIPALTDKRKKSRPAASGFFKIFG